MSEVLPAKARVEIFRGPPLIVDDHFLKGWTNVYQGTITKTDDEIIIKIPAAQTWAAHGKSVSFNTNTYKYAVVRCTTLWDPSSATWQFEAKLGGVVKVLGVFSETGLKVIDLLSQYAGDIDEIVIRVDGSYNYYVTIDYVAICKSAPLIPTDTGDVVDFLRIVRPVLQRGIGSFSLLLPNWNSLYTGQISEHDNIIIWLARNASDLGDPAYKVFGGKIAKITYEGVRGPEFYIRLDGFDHGYELKPAPVLLQKLYEAVNGRTIIEDALALCSYLDKHPDASKWFDNTGLSGSTDDRIDSTHDALYDEAQPLTVIQEILEKAKNPSGSVGFDAYIIPSGVMVGHLRNSLDFTSPITSITPITYNKSVDTDRIRNKIKVYGASEKVTENNKDYYTEALSNSFTWSAPQGGSLSLNSDALMGIWSIQLYESSSTMLVFRLSFGTGNEKSAKFPKEFKTFNFSLKVPSGTTVGTVAIRLYTDISNYFRTIFTAHDVQVGGDWADFKIPIGREHEGSGYNGEWSTVGSPDWGSILTVEIWVGFPSSGNQTARVDALFFGGARFIGSAEDSTFPETRFSVETDESLQSDAECAAKASALLEILKDPVTILNEVLVDGDPRYTPGERQRIVVTNDNLDAYFRIVEVHHEVRGPTWDTYLILSDEPQNVDYVFKLLKETQKRIWRSAIPR